MQRGGGGAGGRWGRQEARPPVPLGAACTELGLGSEAGDLLRDAEQESSTVMNCCFCGVLQ